MYAPTAVQFDASLHETSSRTLFLAPAKVGTVCNVHEVPFQVADSAQLTPPLTVYLPTATHDVDEVHSTPFSSASIASAGLGNVCSDQVPLLPLSAIASLPLKPTAMHAVMTAHETPLRRVLVAPPGFGVVWIDQLVPFHASTSENLPDAVVYEPAATQEIADRQWSACSSASVAPTGEPADWFVHVLPFQYCAYGAPTLLVTLRPTAVHALVLDGAHAMS